MTFGLIGYPLSHSFSRPYFTEKFKTLGLEKTHRYLNFEMEDVQEFLLLTERYPDLQGCNVTIPHKENIIPLLDELDPLAQKIGAVNCITCNNGRTKGYNTDCLGFQKDFTRHLRTAPKWKNASIEGTHALVLGTGGASKAILVALENMGIKTTIVSRRPGPGQISYSQVDSVVLDQHPIIVNTTPVGMSPHVNQSPSLPYGYLKEFHLCYDLIYNPSVTLFMQKAKDQGAWAVNGLGMLHAQAEEAWRIWTTSSISDCK